jgi:hypothetical protein
VKSLDSYILGTFCQLGHLVLCIGGHDFSCVYSACICHFYPVRSGYAISPAPCAVGAHDMLHLTHRNKERNCCLRPSTFHAAVIVVKSGTITRAQETLSSPCSVWFCALSALSVCSSACIFVRVNLVKNICHHSFVSSKFQFPSIQTITFIGGLTFIASPFCRS